MFFNFVGDQARKFFLQSGLPASVLAEIWYKTHICAPNIVTFVVDENPVCHRCYLSHRTLADMNMDGKMDRLEFSIAMKLIKLKLQGTALPSALPIIMKQPPVPAPTSVMSAPNYGTVFLHVFNFKTKKHKSSNKGYKCNTKRKNL